MNRRQFFWKVFKHSFHGAFRFLEAAEAAAAIAFYSASYHFPSVEKGFKVIFPIIFGLMALTLLVGFLFSAYSVYKKEYNGRVALQSLVDGRARGADLRNRLGAAMAEGQRLLAACGQESEPPPEGSAQAWADGTEVVLRDGLGDSYVARFRSHAGLPMSANSIASIPHRNLWSGINTRLARLEQFLAELGAG